MTFVLGDKLAGVTRTLQLVNLGGPGGHLRSGQELGAPVGGTAGGPLPAPCSPAGGASGRTEEIHAVSAGPCPPPGLPSLPFPPSTDLLGWPLEVTVASVSDLLGEVCCGI